MTPDQIDRLAAFCELEEKGYDHRIFGVGSQGWAPSAVAWMDGYDAEKFTWRPDRDDNDCRMVLEACREKGIITRVADELYGKFCVDTSDWGINAELSEWMLMVSPEQKCQAVLKVIGDQT